MSYGGVHFAIKNSDLSALWKFSSDEERMDYVHNVIEEDWDENLACDTDKSWALIHSALQLSNPCSDELERKVAGPASWAVLGKDDLSINDDGMIGCSGKFRVWQIDRFLRKVSTSIVADRLRGLIEKYKCKSLDEEDIDYAVIWYPKLVDFYERAASARRHVIFSVDF